MLSLTELIDPWNAAEQNVVVSGTVELSQLPRLVGLMAVPSGIVQCQLNFFHTTNSRHCVQGRIEGKVSLICQRCLTPMDMLLGIDVLLVLVSSDYEAMRLSENYEPLIVTDKLIKPLDIAEDELVLALPDVPIHENEICLINYEMRTAAFYNNGFYMLEAEKQHLLQCLKQ